MVSVKCEEDYNDWSGERVRNMLKLENFKYYEGRSSRYDRGI